MAVSDFPLSRRGPTRSSLDAPFLMAAAAGAVFGHGTDRLFSATILVVFAALAWITGRACRYVLEGR